VYDNVEDFTTTNMHRICVSLSTTLEVNESYTEPSDDIEERDITLTVTKTPQSRDVSGIKQSLSLLDRQRRGRTGGKGDSQGQGRD
jgi:hypothetical protein